MTSYNSEKINKTLKSIPLMIGFFIVILFVNGIIIKAGLTFALFSGVIPILVFLGGIWEIPIAVDFIKIIFSNLKKIRTYFKNSYNKKGQPKVVFWFEIFCLINIFLSLIFILIQPLLFSNGWDDFAVFALISSIIGLALFLPPFFLPRKQWVWIYNLTILGISLTGIITIPVLVPLIVLYAKPEVRKFYKS